MLNDLKIDPFAVKRLAIGLPNWLGDITMSLSFLASCRENFPAAEIDLIGQPSFQKFPFPPGFHYIPIEKKLWSRFWAGPLRKKAYDIYFVLPASFSSAWLAFRSGAKMRVGYNMDHRQSLLTHPIPYQSIPRSRHIISEWQYLLEYILHRKTRVCPPVLEFQLKLTPEIQRKLAHWQLERGKYILLAPFSAFGPARNWSIEYYTELAQILLMQGHRCVVVGVAADRAEAEKISDTTNLCGQTSLPELMQLLQNSALLIANDSGTRQLAGALSVKNIGILGSSEPTWKGPLDHFSTILYRKEVCSPCYKRTCRFGHYNCLNRITPAEVAITAQSLLTESTAIAVLA